MRLELFVLPALAATAFGQEYRWCLGEKINSGTLRKFNYRMRGIDTVKFCNGGADPQSGIKTCLEREGCAPSSGGSNCGADAVGYFHGGINVGLGCSGDRVKRCIDQNLGISGNTDYVCNITG